jgi:hypothetical protein
LYFLTVRVVFRALAGFKEAGGSGLDLLPSEETCAGVARVKILKAIQ